MMTWDRGTLLVDGPGPGVLWDARVSRWRAPAWRYAELGGRGLVDESFEPADAPSLRPYQSAAVAAWEAAGRRGVVVLPTGAGKTRVAVAAIRRTGRSALIVAPTRVLVEQWRRALPDAGQVGDGVFEPRRVTVATAASARRQVDRLGPRFGLLVVDEAHHDGEELELYPAPLRLGLTATPPADPTRLQTVVGPVVFRMSVEDLSGHWLASFDLVRMPVDLSPADAAAYREAAATFRRVFAAFAQANGPDWRAFLAAAKTSPEVRRAVVAWRRTRELVAWPVSKRTAVGTLLETHREARVLVFVRDNAAAYALARDRLVMPLTCDVGRAERSAALAAFARGELRALVSARVLNEGIDVPEADVAVLVAGSQGEREYVQRVGRVLRPSPGKRALVVELVCRGTHEEEAAERGRGALAAR